MLLSTGFWAAWALPMLLLFSTYLASRYVWKDQGPITVASENARAPFVAGVSVLAIAIPLVANLTFEVSKTTQRFWIVGILLAALTFALVALVIGTILVYRFSLPSDGSHVEISSSLAPWMSIQYSAMVLFLIAAFVGLVCFIIFGGSDSSLPDQVSQEYTITKPLTVLGVDKSSMTDSLLDFCSEDVAPEKAIVAKAEEDRNAARIACSTHR